MRDDELPRHPDGERDLDDPCTGCGHEERWHMNGLQCTVTEDGEECECSVFYDYRTTHWAEPEAEEP